MPGARILGAGVPFLSQHKVPILYKGQTLTQYYKADFVCYGKIIIEVKAVKELINEHRAQAIHYLNATGIRLGLLVNFCAPSKLEYERLVL